MIKEKALGRSQIMGPILDLPLSNCIIFGKLVKLRCLSLLISIKEVKIWSDEIKFIWMLWGFKMLEGTRCFLTYSSYLTNSSDYFFPYFFSKTHACLGSSLYFAFFWEPFLMVAIDARHHPTKLCRNGLSLFLQLIFPNAYEHSFSLQVLMVGDLPRLLLRLISTAKNFQSPSLPLPQYSPYSTQFNSMLLSVQ